MLKGVLPWAVSECLRGSLDIIQPSLKQLVSHRQDNGTHEQADQAHGNETADRAEEDHNDGYCNAASREGLTSRLIVVIASGPIALKTLNELYRDFSVRREKALVHSGKKTRPGTGSLHPVAIGAAVEVTKPPKPPV